MTKFKTLLAAGLLSLGLTGPVAAQDAAPAAPAATATTAAPAPATAPAATPATGDAAATTAAATADATANTDAWVGARPVDGIGQPVSGGMDLQPAVTKIGEDAHFLNNVVLLPLMTVVALFVLGLLLWVVVRYRAGANPNPSKTSHNTVIEVVWTLVPVLILIAIAFPSLSLLAEQYRPAKKDALTVEVKGYQWYWGYAYPDQEIGEYLSKMVNKETASARGEPFQLAVDNRMVVPVNREVKLIITGADVIHSFAVPALWTKMDAVPGRANETTFTATKTGVYYGQCSELCGVDHAFMPIAVEVVSQADFDRWVRIKGGKTAADLAAAAEAAAAKAAAPAPAPAAAVAPVEATPAAAAPAPAAAPAAK